MQRKLTTAALAVLVVAFSTTVLAGPKKKADITGLVVEASGFPVAGAVVSTDGQVAVTDAGGVYTLEKVKVKERVVVRFEADGFATSYGVLDVFDLGLNGGDSDSESDSGSDSDAGSDSDSDSDSGKAKRGPFYVLDKTLVPLGSAQQLDPVAGGAIAEGGFVVSFAPGAVDAVDPVQVILSPIDVVSPEIDAFPGDFIGVDAVGDRVLMETFSLMDVQLVDAATGESVNLAPGATALLEFLLPATTTLLVGDTVGLWFFDETQGLWVEETVGTVGDSTQIPGRLAVFGEVSHFSWWNCDRGIASFNCYSGRVVDALGVPVLGAQVYGRGVDYMGTSFDSTVADGTYCLNVRRDSVVTIDARYFLGGVSVNTQQVTVDTTLPPSTIVSCATGGCTAVEDLVLDGLSCVSGDVRDEFDIPVAGATVVSTVGGFSITAADGSYCFPAPSESPVGVGSEGFPAVNVTTGVDDGSSCDVDPSACAEANIRPAVGGTTCLSGTAFGDDGSDVEDGEVSVFRDEPPFELLGTATFEVDGNFCVEALPPGTPFELVISGLIFGEVSCTGSVNGTTGAAGLSCAADDCEDVGGVLCLGLP